MSPEIPGQKQSEEALDNLAGQGILGSLCVLLIVALFFTLKALLKAKDDRFADQKLMTETLEKHNEAAKALAVEMNKAASALVVESTRNLDSMKNTLAAQERSMDDMARALTSLQQENMQLRVVASNFRCSGSKG
jgi:signal transduction histidine kinase